MKKLATFVFALLLGASLSFAQTGTGTQGGDKGGGTPAPGDAKTTNTKKKGGKKAHKSGKKSKKTQSDSTTSK
jgi:hypothetical protein